MRSQSRTLLALLAAVALAWWGTPPRPLHAQAPDLIPVAQAYTAAWNAHDLDAVLASFAPDAVVRERRGDVPLDVWDSRDPQVVRAYLIAALIGDNHDVLQWVTGHPQIGAWAAARFAQRPRWATGPYTAAGGTVRWPYQEFSDPYQRLRGVGPLEDTAEAVVRDGRISVLTLVLSPASVARRQSEGHSALNHVTQAMAAQHPAPSSPFEGVPGIQPRRL